MILKVATLLFMLTLRSRKRRRKNRSMYIRPIFSNRMNHGELNLVRELNEDPYYHHRYFQMTKETFQEILMLIDDRIQHGQNHLRPISNLERLVITLRYLATGNSQVSLGLNYRISASSVSNIIREVLQVLCEVLSKYLEVPTKDKWQEISSEFLSKWQFPLCCGAIDGKHIRIKAPAASGSQYFNYKGFHSIVLLAVVDANCKFTLIDVGSSGSCSDGGILKSSAIGKKLEKSKYNFPSSTFFNGNEMSSVIIGDDGFPLKPYLLKPVSGRYVDSSEAKFNYRLSRARMVAENSFGLLSVRWRIFLTTIEASPDLASLITRAAVLLHNFLLDKNDTCGYTLDRIVDGVEIPGNWREAASQLSELVSIPRQGSNNSTVQAIELRNAFKNYFNSSQDEVSWQNTRAFRGYD